MGLDIVFYTEGLEFDGAAPFERALGGSETALVCMARELAALGHNVRVYCRCPRPGVYEYEGARPANGHVASPCHEEQAQAKACGYNPPEMGEGKGGGDRAGGRCPPPQSSPGRGEGPVEENRTEAAGVSTPALQEGGDRAPALHRTARVEYRDLAEFERFARLEECDVFVCSRFVRAIGAVRFAKRHVLWCHDVLTEEAAPLVAGLLWKIDGLFVVSEFHKRQWQKHLPMIPDSAFFVTRNGVDLEVVDGARVCRIPPAHPSPARGEGPEIAGAERRSARECAPTRGDATCGSSPWALKDLRVPKGSAAPLHAAAGVHVPVVHNNSVPQGRAPAGESGGKPPHSITEAGAERVIYASRPERGLEILLEMWPELKRRRPGLELLICRYDHPKGDERMAAFLEGLARKAEELDGVRFLGGLSKGELYDAMRTCRLMLYPSTFPEVSCISAIEASACSLPIITSRYCALKETVVDGETGLLIGGGPRSQRYRKAFAEAVQSLLGDDERRKRMGRSARERVERAYRWSEIAKEWSAHFEEWFSGVPRERVLEHLKHNSDLVAARDGGIASEEELGIAWLRNEGRYRQHYEDAAEILRPAGLRNASAGSARDDRNGAGATGPSGPRERRPLQGPSSRGRSPLQEIRNYRFEWLRRHVESRPEIESLVDVGCGGGQFAVGLANAVRRLRVTGADVSEPALEQARNCASEHGVDAGRLRFERWGGPPLHPSPARREGAEVVGAERGAPALQTQAGALQDPEKEGPFRVPLRGVGTPALQAAGGATPALQVEGRFDAAFVGEVLEHVPDVERFVEEVEGLVTDGGWVFATLPFGPWESMSFRENERKGIEPSHVRSWGYRDVMDVFGKKRELDLRHAECGKTSRGEPVGHWMLAYRAGGETGRYDYARKLRCNPRQSLSVCMILGGSEAGLTLHRCLGSVRGIADEIVIAWSRCDEETLRIARQYADVLFEIPWVEEDGLPNFAAARNRSIERAKGDWILWLDADEHLVGADELAKYLRENMYNAYVIRQWHHAIDSQFAPDTPMRCFRNGMGIKFYGAIHEHPETGLNEGIKPHVILTDVNIVHDGYVTEGKRVERFRRNLPILVKDRRLFPERRLGELFWLRDLVQSARHQMMGIGGPAQRSRRLLEEAVKLYRGRFADPAAEYHAQAMPFYQQAMALLGRGMPLRLVVAVPDGQGAIGAGVGREASSRPTGAVLLFESADEAAEYAAGCARAALAQPPWADEFAFEE